MSKTICDLRLKTWIFAIFLQLSDKIVVADTDPLLYLTITGTVSARFSLIILVNSDASDSTDFQNQKHFTQIKRLRCIVRHEAGDAEMAATATVVTKLGVDCGQALLSGL
jgi:hypothetical protein